MNFLVNNDQQRAQMLKEIGVSSSGDLFSDIPSRVMLQRDLDIGPPLSEPELLDRMRRLSGKNRSLSGSACFLGAGVYNHFPPSVVLNLVSRSEFNTSYTPYQAEISQGFLQALYEYQTIICRITSMEVSNASMYDGATALAEGAGMAANATKRKTVLVSSMTHPEYRNVLATYCSARELRLETLESQNGEVALDSLKKKITPDTCAVAVQTPNFLGILEKLDLIEPVVHGSGALLIVCAVEPTSLGILKPPGDYGADVVVGEGQGLGLPPSLGGGSLGFLATRNVLLQKIPGRLVGMTKDKDGRRGFILTLQAREQHVRRARAGSNICTNHALHALAAAIYLSALGEQGFKKLAMLNAQKANYLHRRIAKIGGFRDPFNRPFFNEFTVECPCSPSRINNMLYNQGIIGGLDLSRFYREHRRGWLLAVTECTTRSQMDRLLVSLEEMSQ